MYDIDEFNQGRDLEGMEPDEVITRGCIAFALYMVALFLLAIICACFSSCASHKTISETERHDSVRVETRVETIYVPDTVFVEIPAQSAERTTADSTSHLETEFAESDARINPDGTLYHFLANKAQEKPVEIQKQIVKKDSIVYRDRYNKITITKTKEVHKLYWWQKTCIYGFFVCLLILLWKYRKKILGLIKYAI